MAQKVDYQTTVDNFEELARAVEERSKVVLTCRTPYFRTREEAEELLHGRPTGAWEGAAAAAELPERPAIDLSERPNFEIVHLLPFDDGDVQAILQKRATEEWEDYWEQIQDTYNLPELAQRPVLLDMIVRSFPQLEPGQAINAARLYELYTDLWLARDWERGRTLITRDDKQVFMQQLALEMHRRQELSLHYSRVSERVQEYFHLEKKTEIDYFDYDVRTCSFLNRDPEGNYRFLHRSFGEFFVAQWLAPKLLDGTAPEMTINEEIRGFVHGLLEGADWPAEPPEGVVVPEGMVWVPAGPFIMGGRDGLDVQVAHLEQGFFVARAPVTNAEYARFVEATGYVTTAEKKGVGYVLEKKRNRWVRTPGTDWRHPDGPDSTVEDRMDHPVVQVSWDDAVAYAEWAGVRLPAEEEWEKAARGIDGRIYPWGDGFDPARCNTRESGIRTTTPVGRYSSEGDSPCGCADAAGNVWQWTASEWEPDSERRVARGGSWSYGQGFACCAFRGWNPPDFWSGILGFRVVVSRASG
jgi:formylglycine-generating enzyme required for sulfatase activity